MIYYFTGRTELIQYKNICDIKFNINKGSFVLAKDLYDLSAFVEQPLEQRILLLSYSLQALEKIPQSQEVLIQKFNALVKMGEIFYNDE